jgi:hypothetical protein
MDNLFGNIKKMNKNDNTDIDEKKLDKKEVLSRRLLTNHTQIKYVHCFK